MKTGKSLTELATELARQNETKHDYLMPAGRALAVIEDDRPALQLADVGTLPIGTFCHGQLAERLGVPRRYYDRMTGAAPSLWVQSINTWLREIADEQRMFRVMDGKVRAFLSDRYRRMDNFDVANVALPILMESGDMELASCEVTERRLYLKALFPGRRAEVAVGDIVEAGVMLCNSEVGDGALSVSPFLHRLVCLNGAVINDARWSRFHIGKQQKVEGVRLAADTQQAQDKAMLLELRDVIRAAGGEVFDRTVHKLRQAAGSDPIKHPTEAVVELARAVGLMESEQEGVLERLIRGADYSRYGAMNAITNMANTAHSYDRATELETAGWRVIDLPANDWRQIAEAA